MTLRNGVVERHLVNWGWPRTLLQENKVTAENLNKFFVSVCIAEGIKQISVPEWTFSECEHVEIRNLVVWREEVLELTDDLQTIKSTGPGGIHSRVLEEFKCKITDFLKLRSATCHYVLLLKKRKWGDLGRKLLAD